MESIDRATKGVRIINLDDNDRVRSMAKARES